MINYFKNFTALLLSVFILAGCDTEDTPKSLENITISTTNKFLQYPNPQFNLPEGNYTIVAATATAGQTDSFTITVTFDDGSTQTFSGQWTSSGGQDSTSAANPNFSFTVKKSGGVKISISSTVDNYLYLLNRNITDNIVAEDNDSGTGTNAMIEIAQSKIQNTAWAAAYYAAIDPGNNRDTLAKWKTVNGFGSGGTEIHVIFRDTKDLGYGRDMYLRQNANGCVAIYVENYLVDIIKGLPYTTLNLTAAIEQDKLHHFGSNAIEFSDLDGDCDGADPMFPKFFTFKADTTDFTADEVRLLNVDLDGRGAKAMPGPCIACHGGTARPLLANGTFASSALPDTATADVAKRVGDTNAKLQPLEVDTFEFSDKAGWTRADLEEKLRQINEIVYSTYPAAAAAPTGEWTADFLREVVNGWYGNTLSTANTAFDTTFVPSGWQYDVTDNNPPASAEELFLKVVKPYCFACHSKRGSSLGTNANASGNGKDLDFSTYQKFISYADTIEDYVYERGIMPLSLLTYDKFWESTAPEILASHIPGFSHQNTDGSISQPGKPVANPGLDRSAKSPVTLSAASSLFANTYTWSLITTPAGSTATIDDVNSIRPTLTGDMDGVYTLQLIVGNGSVNSTAATLNITINDALTHSSALTFDTHIKPIIQGVAAPNTLCVTCHAENLAPVGPPPESLQPGVPLYYTDSAILYSEVLKRINFDKPELSPILLKPSGNHHFGNLQEGFGLTGDFSHYNTVLNWILAGAREN
jgi:mono/diheme cytochrome c family protein